MKSISWRPWIMTMLCVVCTGSVAVLHYLGYDTLVRAELYSADVLAGKGRLAPANTNLVFIGITQGAYDDVPLERDPEAQRSPDLLAMRETFPWPRSVLAHLLERLAQAGARVIIFDFVFKAQGEGDEELARALDRYKDRVVIGGNFSKFGRGSSAAQAGTEATLMLPNASVLRPAAGHSAGTDNRVGYVNHWPDLDEVIRKVKFRKSESEFMSEVAEKPVTLEHDFFYEAMAARALNKMGQADAIPPGDEPVPFRYTAPPGRFYRPHPVDGIFRSNVWHNNYRSGEFFRNKVVIVGPAANIFHDEHDTPLGPKMLGPELHLNVINAALQHEFLREMSPAVGIVVICLSGLVALVLCFRVYQPLLRMLIIVCLSAVYVLLGYWLFNHANLVILVIGPLVVLNLCGVTALGYDFVAERLARLQLRATMGFYFSPRVLQEVLANPGAMEPRQAHVTLLLTDLRNSTPLAERLGPSGMFQLLNRVFEVQTGAIMGEEGNLEHFLGDQFLSYWGAPQEQPDAADRALRAALKLIEGMERLKETLNPEVKRLFGYGVALHRGPVLVGNKGSTQRLDYGLVGDTVNEAARVESLTKYYGVTLLITREAFKQLSQPPPSRLIDRVIVKGKSVPVELLELQNLCSARNFPALVRDYEAAFKDYAAGNFSTAQVAFQKLADEHQDGASRRLAERCVELAATSPADWNGTWRMESK